MKRILITAIAALMLLPAFAQETGAGDNRQALETARLLKSQYKFDEAITVLTSCLSPGSFDPAIMKEIADCHFQSGNAIDAAGVYALLYQLDPTDLTVKVRLAAISYRQKDYGNAILFGREITATDTIPAITTMVGDSYAALEQPDSARVWYTMTLDRQPRNAGAITKLSAILLQNKEYDKILDLTGGYMEYDSTNATINQIRAKIFYIKKDYDKTIDLLTFNRDSLEDDSYHTHLYLGLALRETFQFKDVEKELVRAWQIDSTDYTLALNIARVKSIFNKDFSSGVKEWYDKAEAVLTPDPLDLYNVYKTAGDDCVAKEDFDMALGYYEKALAAYPTGLVSVYSIAYCHMRKKDYAKARTWYERYLKAGKPGTKLYEAAQDDLDYVKRELFMLEK